MYNACYLEYTSCVIYIKRNEVLHPNVLSREEDEEEERGEEMGEEEEQEKEEERMRESRRGLRSQEGLWGRPPAGPARALGGTGPLGWGR